MTPLLPLEKQGYTATIDINKQEEEVIRGGSLSSPYELAIAKKLLEKMHSCIRMSDVLRRSISGRIGPPRPPPRFRHGKLVRRAPPADVELLDF
jgi:hypothetical protein